MIVFLFGKNSEILKSFTQHVDEHEIKLDSNIWSFMNLAGKFRLHRSFIAIFDVNDADDNFNDEVQLIRKNFPKIPLWAIFDSESPSLTNELSRMGFIKIISYQDDLAMLLSEDQAPK